MDEIIKDTDDVTHESLLERNPRFMVTHKDSALGGSMDRYGDLGGITRNTIPGQHFITGHQRMRKLKEKYGSRVKIHIERTLAEPDEFGTVAIGYVGVDGTSVRFSYREVRFSEADEATASLAANNATGQNDEAMLAEIDYELSQLENGDSLLALTGQSEDDWNKLLESVGGGPLGNGEEESESEKKEKHDDGMKRLQAKFTEEQLLEVEEAIMIAKREKQFTGQPNNDLSANALHYICLLYTENITSQNEQQTNENTLQPSDETFPVQTAPETLAQPSAEAAPQFANSTTYSAPSEQTSSTAHPTDLTSIPSA